MQPARKSPKVPLRLCTLLRVTLATLNCLLCGISLCASLLIPSPGVGRTKPATRCSRAWLSGGSHPT